jgi:DNA excision repair protein ERCC-2
MKIEGNHITLAVKELLPPTYNTNFTSSFPLPQRGLLGREAHTKIQLQKSKSYGFFHSEYFVSYDFHYLDYFITINGRIDGIFKLPESIEIEEIKSVLLTPKEFSKFNVDDYPNFKNQLLYYGWLLQMSEREKKIKTFLTVVNLTNDKQKKIEIPYLQPQVEKSIFENLTIIINTIISENKIYSKKMEMLNKVRFSLKEKRPQQEKMMEAVAKALNAGEHLLCSAPTGTGKTAAAILPTVKHSIRNTKKIFFCTAKTTQQDVVYQTLQPIISQGLELKILFLRASKKMCCNDAYFCHEDYCPFIKNFRTRLMESNLLKELLSHSILKPNIIYDKAKGLNLCPFEVSMELTPLVDLIVGDYNYIFDPAVFIRRLFNRKDYRNWILIIDEAHNLYDRGMDYLSPDLSKKSVSALIKQVQPLKSKVYSDLLKALQQIDRFLTEIHKEGEIYHGEQSSFNVELKREELDEIFKLYENAFLKYLIDKIKKKILTADDPCEQLYYQLRKFNQIAKYEESAFVPFYSAKQQGILKIQCCDPSHYLTNKIEKFHSVIAMSATLDPIHFYQTILGFSEKTETLQLSSPFPSKNRKYIVVKGISTKFRNRASSYAKIAEIIQKTVQVKKGNYLCFFPSYEYMQNVNIFLGGIKLNKMIQLPGMTEKDRDQVLDVLRETDGENILLGVTGGVFSEGVDFAGEMAVGVFIISPTLPKISYERELQRNYWQEKMNQGMEFAYIYPGMNKVVQAVGRLIRNSADQGVALLIGERFALDGYASIFPAYWHQNKPDFIITENYLPEVQKFWKSIHRPI